VRGERDGKDRGGGPTQEQRDRVGEQRPRPAEVAPYVAVAVELCISLGGECAGEKDPEQEKYDSANLAGERRLGRLIVPVPARAS
jgi:hypothetical protein